MKGNKLKLLLSIPAVSACILFGCEKKERILLEDLQPVLEEAMTEEEAAETQSAKEAKEAEAPKEAAGEMETGEQEDKSNTESIVVHICGAVVNPGVYELPKGSRIFQAVEAAGGFQEEAGQDFLNQAALLSDGVKLYVPTMEEMEDIRGNLSESFWENTSEGISEENSGLVNINTADEEELCTLTGIGSGKARSIIDYRENNGNFQKIEDIMKVEGIKDGLFRKIRDSITV